MPSKTFLVNFLLLSTKIYVHLQVLFHSSVADIFRNDQKLNICPSEKIPSFEDNAVCVIPLDGTCEDNQATKPNSFKCGPGSECFNTTCTCLKGHEAYEDHSGCKLSNIPSSHATTIPLISTEKNSPTEALTASIISNSTKNEDQSGKKTTRKEYYVVAPTTIDAIKVKPTVPTTVVYNDTNSVVFAHLISRTGAGSQGGYHKGSYYGTPRNNTAISTQRVYLNNAFVCSIISSVAFHQFHF